MIPPVRHDSDRGQRVDTRFRRLFLRVQTVPRVRERIAGVYHASTRFVQRDPHVDRTITVKDGVISVKDRVVPGASPQMRSNRAAFPPRIIRCSSTDNPGVCNTVSTGVVLAIGNPKSVPITT